MDWIPVDEKAPERGQLIICTGFRGAVFMGYYVGCVEGGFQFKRHVVVKSKGGSRRIGIEAWMPAPEPYANLKKQEEFLKIREAYYKRQMIFARKRKRPI